MGKSKITVPMKVAKDPLYKDLINRGQDEGCLTKKEVRETVRKVKKVNQNEIEAIYRSLERKKIKLVTRRKKAPVKVHHRRKEPPKEPLESDIKLTHDIKIDDSVKVYLREIGWVPLLTPADRHRGGRAPSSDRAAGIP